LLIDGNLYINSGKTSGQGCGQFLGHTLILGSESVQVLGASNLKLCGVAVPLYLDVLGILPTLHKQKKKRKEFVSDK
jgi:hypothetical protein